MRSTLRKAYYRGSYQTRIGALLNYYRNVIGMNLTEDEITREVAITMNYGGEEVLIEMND